MKYLSKINRRSQALIVVFTEDFLKVPNAQYALEVASAGTNPIRIILVHGEKFHKVNNLILFRYQNEIS